MAQIQELVAEYRVQEVIIAMPTAPGKVMREIVRLCEEAGVACRSMPGIYELLDGRISVSRIRKVNIEDLLRREPVRVRPPNPPTLGGTCHHPPQNWGAGGRGRGAARAVRSAASCVCKEKLW